MTQPSRRPLPTSAFVAVTMLCNSRCVHCDIWKNRGKDFLPVPVYSKLPSSLTMVDITGGEPFLRPDIPDIIRTVRQACPKARILITTNGFLPRAIQRDIRAIVTADPRIALRISLDGWGKMHERIRGIPGAFDLVMETLAILQSAGVRDIGLTFTLMRVNRAHMLKVYEYTRVNNLSFSLNVVHDSPIYYGTGKQHLSPIASSVKPDFERLFVRQMQSINPRDWGKAWFNRKSLDYMERRVRPLPCGAGENFFYMDPHARIFPCQIKNWPIGNLQRQNFEDIWYSDSNTRYIAKAKSCNDCWIICTAKDAIRKNPLTVAGGIARHLIDDRFTRTDHQ